MCLHSTRHAGARLGSPFSVRKESLCSEARRDQWKRLKLDVMGKRENNRLIPGKLWDDTQRLKEQGAGRGLLVTMRCMRQPGIHLHSLQR